MIASWRIRRTLHAGRSRRSVRSSVRDGRGRELRHERVGVEALERERRDQAGVLPVATSSASVVPTIGAALKP